MKIEIEKKNHCFGDIKVGECFITASGVLFIKADISAENQFGVELDGAVNLETGKPEYFGDGAIVFPVFAKVVIEGKECIKCGG